MAGSGRAPGTVRHITSAANPALKAIRALEVRKYRAQTKLFVAEGVKLVHDALDAGWPPQTVVMVAGERTPVADSVAARARAAGADVIETTPELMRRLTHRDNPQAMLGVFPQRFARLAEVGASGVWVALDRARDPGNIGTIVRTVDAAGGAGVLLIGETADPYGIEAVRATMGSIFHVPLARASAEAFLAWRAGFAGEVIGTHLAGATDHRAVPYREPAVLLMGAEQSGLSDDLAAACDRLVRIPMAGRADSLNLAVATGIVLFEMRREQLRL